jgi:hypothetical protein
MWIDVNPTTSKQSLTGFNHLNFFEQSACPNFCQTGIAYRTTTGYGPYYWVSTAVNTNNFPTNQFFAFCTLNIEQVVCSKTHIEQVAVT